MGDETDIDSVPAPASASVSPSNPAKSADDPSSLLLPVAAERRLSSTPTDPADPPPDPTAVGARASSPLLWHTIKVDKLFVGKTRDMEPGPIVVDAPPDVCDAINVMMGYFTNNYQGDRHRVAPYDIAARELP